MHRTITIRAVPAATIRQAKVRTVKPARQIKPARPAQLAGLGASAQEIVGTAGTLATSITAAGTSTAITGALPFMAALGPAAPFVAIGAVVATLLAQYIGKGCGSACVDASKAEQIYEAATDNLWAVARAGMITVGQFLTGANAFLQAGQQHLAQFNTKQAQKGSQNMTNVISQMINTAPGTSGNPAPAPLDLNRAHSLYLSGPGWYPDSLAAASQLTDAYLQSLPPAQLPQSTGDTTSTAAPVATVSTSAGAMLQETILGVPLWMWGAGAAALLLLRD